MHSLAIAIALITTPIVGTFVGITIGYWLTKEDRIEDWWWMDVEN